MGGCPPLLREPKGKQVKIPVEGKAIVATQFYEDDMSFGGGQSHRLCLKGRQSCTAPQRIITPESYYSEKES